MKLDSKIYVAGHNGMVGSAIVRHLTKLGYKDIITLSKSQLNLLDQNSVDKFFREYSPEYVFLAAAKVGGIKANRDMKADFIYENLMIQTNIIKSSYSYDVKKLIFLGSSCIYPKFCNQPIKEEYLMTGELEQTNDAYAIAKIAGIKMCQAYRKQYGVDYISAMPCNLYGVNDNFHPTNSHVLPALIRRFHEAKVNNLDEVVCWGDGSARREFLNADDVANASLFLMNNYSSDDIINIGYGADYTIKEVVEIIKNVVGYNGTIVWDTTKPNGTPKRLLDSTKLFNMGWKPKIQLKDGITTTYDWYVKNI